MLDKLESINGFKTWKTKTIINWFKMKLKEDLVIFYNEISIYNNSYVLIIILYINYCVNGFFSIIEFFIILIF